MHLDLAMGLRMGDGAIGERYPRASQEAKAGVVAANMRTGMATPDGNITTYAWTDDDQLAAVTLPNGGGIVTNTYNGDGEPTSWYGQNCR